MTNTSWAAEVRSDKWWQDEEPQRAIDILEALVDTNIDASSAAEQITFMYKPLVKAEPSSVAIIWGILVRVVRAVGQNEAAAKKLVDFVLHVQNSGDVLDEAGEQINLNGQAIWRDLPEFSYHFREYGIYIEDADDYKGDWLEQASQLQNATTFAALFLEASDPRHMSFLASSGLIDGVELAYARDQAERAAMFIPPAVIWIKLAGKTLHKLCQDRIARSATLGVKRPGSEWLWNGGVGFSPERWDFWKRRFGELAGQAGLDEHLQTLAREAEAKMEEIGG
ncbi:hypothetical protein TruAng_002270 [Truncatella angustata]|nr:hypothetical protein TruAng_002270 [Truncatella angustata]